MIWRGGFKKYIKSKNRRSITLVSAVTKAKNIFLSQKQKSREEAVGCVLAEAMANQAAKKADARAKDFK